MSILFTGNCWKPIHNVYKNNNNNNKSLLHDPITPPPQSVRVEMSSENIRRKTRWSLAAGAVLTKPKQTVETVPLAEVTGLLGGPGRGSGKGSNWGLCRSTGGLQCSRGQGQCYLEGCDWDEQPPWSESAWKVGFSSVNSTVDCREGSGLRLLTAICRQQWKLLWVVRNWCGPCLAVVPPWPPSPWF